MTIRELSHRGDREKKSRREAMDFRLDQDVIIKITLIEGIINREIRHVE